MGWFRYSLCTAYSQTKARKMMTDRLTTRVSLTLFLGPLRIGVTRDTREVSLPCRHACSAFARGLTAANQDSPPCSSTHPSAFSPPPREDTGLRPSFISMLGIVGCPLGLLALISTSFLALPYEPHACRDSFLNELMVSEGFVERPISWGLTWVPVFALFSSASVV